MPTLNWIGKQAVEKHHLEIPYRLLEYDESLSVGDWESIPSGKESGNLLVQGDNLHALKALLPYYAGKVKCIYIDPPYNTGNEGWQYNDNVNSPEIKTWLNKVVGSEGEDLSRHDKWLCMMYPRVALLYKLLRRDGVIFISIDDNEFANLKLLMDLIFGAQNMLASLVWEGALKNDSKFISVSHDYILCYAKSKEYLKVNKEKWRTRKEGIDEIYKVVDKLKSKYNNDFQIISEELQKWFKSLSKNHSSWQHRHYKLVDKVGVFFPGDISWPGGNGPDYDVFHPLTKKLVKKPKGGWRYAKYETMLEEIIKDRILFGEDENKVPNVKRYLHETEGQVLPSVIYKDRRAAMQRLRALFNSDIFENPKDEEVLLKLFEATTNHNDIILDSFAGSGTTGHAVMELNKEDGGNRKFILVELEEKIAKEVTAERLKRVVNGYTTNKQNGNGDKVVGLGGGFRYCNLGEPLFDKFGNVRQGVKFKELARHIFFSENGVPLSEKAKLNTPLIGTYKGVAYYLLFNGILGDKTVNGGNVLTSRILESLPKHNGPKIIFGESNRLSAARLKKENIVFKQIPYEIKTS